MLGAILGDIAGSRFEFAGNRQKPKELFTVDCFDTDDTILSCAVSNAVLDTVKDGKLDKLQSNVIKWTVNMYETYRRYPYAGWGSFFRAWVEGIESGEEFKPLKSKGNGCAMKISSVPYIAKSMDECKEMTKTITSVTHDHEESYKAAECLTTSMYMALEGATRDMIRQHILGYYPQVANLTYEWLNVHYQYTELAEETLPAAMICFLESKSFEDAIGMAISIGGDADTLGAITGAMAESFYGWSKRRKDFLRYVDMLISDWSDIFYNVPAKALNRFLEESYKRRPEFYGVKS